MTSVKASSISSGFFQAFPIVEPQYTATSAPSIPPQAPSCHRNLSDDPIIVRILALYLPQPIPHQVDRQLHDFAREVLQPGTLAHTIDADVNPPTVHPLTTFGVENKVNPLKTSHGWRALEDIQTRAGVVGYGFTSFTATTGSTNSAGNASRTNTDQWNRRIHQFTILHIWSGSSAVATCPVAMTDGAAVLLSRHLLSQSSTLDAPTRHVFTESLRRLTSFDPDEAWTSGQWMTERSGGSDVRGTETIARKLTPPELEHDKSQGRDADAIGLPLGPWRIDGFKWFSSATDADMTILLAKTEKGLSAFYAPMRRRTASITTPTNTTSLRLSATAPPTEMNGITISRLKSKLGTRAVPTAEVSITGMRAYLIGNEGEGIKEISSILNITRLHTASSVNGLGRGLAVARAYAKVRKVKGGMLLADNAAHVRWMSAETVRYRAMTHFYFFGVALLGVSEQGIGVMEQTVAGRLGLIPRGEEDVAMLMRMLTPVMKACCSLAAVEGLRACMESLGGVGYCENNEDGGVMNIARLFRDAAVMPIWEGTTSVMCEDMIRVVKNKRDEDILQRCLGRWMKGVLARCEEVFLRECQATKARFEKLQTMVHVQSVEELLWNGREVLAHFEAVVCACLLMADAISDGDEIAIAVSRRWVGSKVEHESDGSWDRDWRTEVEMDRRIFLGDRDANPQKKPRL